MTPIETTYNQQERIYVTDRFILLAVLALVAFIVSDTASGKISENALLCGFVFLAALLYSAVYIYLINRFPNRFPVLRKHLLLFADIALLTYLAAGFEEGGLFVLPFYLLIVMRAGLDLGATFFSSAILLSGISWFILYCTTAYWQQHLDVIEMFAVTTLIVGVLFQRIVLRLDEENMALNETLQEVSMDATHDELTGVANRKRYKEVIRKYTQDKLPFALLFIDLNKFKEINDTYGHHVGDEVLKEVARRLKVQCDEDDFIARLGGDEFAVITPRKREYMKKFVEKLEKHVMGRHRVGHMTVSIELSIGIAHYPYDAKSVLLLGKYADEAMYCAKKDRMGYHCFFEDIQDKDKETGQI